MEPHPPLNVTVVSKSSRVVNISWIDGFDGNSAIKNYRVDIESSEDNAELAGAACQGSLSDSSCVVSSTSASFGNLSPWTTYSFKVFATNEVGTSNGSSVVNATTDEEGTVCKQCGCFNIQLRWPNTVFAHAFANAIQRVHKDLKKLVWRQCQSDHLIYSPPALSMLFFFITERSVFTALIFNYKDMLEKVTVQRTQQFSAFVCFQKNPVKCNACTVARKIETDCFCRNLPISNDPVSEIWQKIVQKPCE